MSYFIYISGVIVILRVVEEKEKAAMILMQHTINTNV